MKVIRAVKLNTRERRQEIQETSIIRTVEPNGHINGTCICRNRFSFPMMAAAVSDVAASNPGPSSWGDVAWPCCPGDGMVVAAVLPDCFACSNRLAPTTNCGRDRVANDQSIPSGEYYGEVTLLAFHRLLVAVDARNCNSKGKK